jgi:nitrous oxide reductase accessory protein NosL
MFIKVTLIALTLLTSLHANSLKKGEKIFSLMCDKKRVLSLSSQDIAQLQKQIETQHLCGKLSKTNLTALTYFLTHKEKHQNKHRLTPPKDARCPVCGMFTAKYPKWTALIQTQKGEKHYFDGVKDMMKFYFDPLRFHHDKEDFAQIEVTDYYTLQAIDAQKSYFVLGSNIYGPMGEELIPFKTQADAQHFKSAHHGKSIHTFDTIKEKFLY